MLFFFRSARLPVLSTTFRQHNIASPPLPRPCYCLYPHRWAFSKGILHSAGEFSSGWKIIQKYLKTGVRQEVSEEFSLKNSERVSMVGYINSWENAQMYRWFHKASFMYLGKKILGFYGPPIQISLKSSLTILHAQSLVLVRKHHHIFIIMRNVQKPIYFKISGCFWNDSDQFFFSKHRK